VADSVAHAHWHWIPRREGIVEQLRGGVRGGLRSIRAIENVALIDQHPRDQIKRFAR